MDDETFALVLIDVREWGERDAAEAGDQTAEQAWAVYDGCQWDCTPWDDTTFTDEQWGALERAYIEQYNATMRQG